MLTYKNKLLIGIGGVARSGKDSLAAILKERFERDGIATRRIALADELKNKIQAKLIAEYGIDVWNCTPEEKEKIRPELVAFGRDMREQSRGAYWTQIVDEKLKDFEESVIIVPDIRYNRYPGTDEVPWIQRHDGILFWVCRFNLDEKYNAVYIQAANSEEQENDPYVYEAADMKLAWQTLPVVELEKKYGRIFDEMVAYGKIKLRELNR